MHYAEVQPAASLAPYVRCIWTFDDDDGDGAAQRIVPDGRPELIVHCDEPYREVDGTRAARQPRILFAGQLTRPLWLQAGVGSRVIGVRFHPAGAHRFLGTALEAFTDARVDVASLWPEEEARLWSEVQADPDRANRITAVERSVGRRIAASGIEEDAIVAGCVAAMERQPHAQAVDAIAADAGIGRRQLERRFRRAVGISPGTLADILRFRRVFDAIEHDSTRPWTDAAAAAGYFDQSHLVRDFRRFVGCTPTEFAASRPGLATALVEP
jgi:AraC-like DNA-binding protein